MKSGIREIAGKAISDVVAVQCDTQPREQVFIVFSDESNEIDSLVERLIHQNSSIRCWMMEIGWITRTWIDVSRAISLLLKNLADTLAWPFMAAGLATAIVAQDKGNDDDEGFYRIAQNFDPASLYKKQYQERIEYIREHGILEVQSPFWMLETQCRRMISGAAFGQQAGARTSKDIGPQND